MRKKLVLFIAISMLLFQPTCCTFAKSAMSSPMKVAIKKYKHGNYTGCLQDCLNLVSSHPSAVAYYYMAMSYVQAGKKDEAIKAYAKALSLKPNSKIAEYATTGKRCLETPDKCHLEVKSDSGTSSPELDKLIASPPSDGLSTSVRKEFRQMRLDNVKQQINNGKEVDDYSFNKLNYNTDEVNSLKRKPSNDEVVAALKVLKDAGLSPYSQEQVDAVTNATAAKKDVAVKNDSTSENNATGNSYTQAASNYENKDLNELNMMMGGSNQQNGNSALNMIPFMVAQNKDGKSNYSPQMMQAAIMSSMMSNYDFNINGDDKNK